ncbi:hypothetical protein [Chryseobacterium sp.]|uniref:hypothetical protein n=1 Tax=unclassified Chryseobacterium TaxID=2593645 RepID=UPI00289DF2C2|nr:hypothetical protein [Chryseobacterium sp.]
MNLQQLQQLRDSIQKYRNNPALNNAEEHVTHMQKSNSQEYNLINGSFVLTEINNSRQASEDLLIQFEDLITQLENILKQNP